MGIPVELPFHIDHAAEEGEKGVGEKEEKEKEKKVHKPVRMGQGAKTELMVVLEVCSREELSVGLEGRCPRLHYIIYTEGQAPRSREPCTCGTSRGRIGQ